MTDVLLLGVEVFLCIIAILFIILYVRLDNLASTVFEIYKIQLEWFKEQEEINKEITIKLDKETINENY